ncbi:2-dehydropantoate 2-reductase [Marinomonas aquimarina]|uniref:2-dehydropantoate 2-reductase n=1 Tax=Marinomonas aquimarina TaxID=295068 RepID=A0A1A8TMJ6_9GAMM|nr:2-dehydropantoate 2-reductase [Marinomonas aquimarina]SBS35245.1 2-dehydropantoate 2-reductase [Marinomonas aquimarina]
MTKDAWLVVGNGAIGLLWASKLRQLEQPVTVLCRSDVPNGMLTVEDLDEEGSQQQTQYDVEFITKEQLEGKYTKVLLCTKAFDLVDAYLDIRKHTKKRGLIATLCNGLGAQQDLIPHLKKQQNLWAGITSEGALKLDSNRVKKTGNGDAFFGLLAQSESNLYGDSFPYPDVQCHNIERRLLEKLAVNAVINPLTAIFSVRNGQVLEDPVKPIFEAAIDELANVMQLDSFKFKTMVGDITSEQLNMRIANVARLTAMNCSSMYEDVRHNRQTENEYISGFFHREAPNASAPLQDAFYAALNDQAHLEEHKKKLLAMH